MGSSLTGGATAPARDDGPSLDTHPYVRAWASGELTQDDLRAFVSQFYHLVDALPRHVSRVHAGCGEPAVRAELIHLLVALEGGDLTPAALWLQTCAALGLFSDSVRRAPLTSGCEHCLFALARLSAAGTPEGLGSLGTMLRELPAMLDAQRDGLVNHYDMGRGPGTEFFEAFAYQAKTHARTVDQLLAGFDEPDAERAAAAGREARVALDALLAEALASSRLRRWN